MDMTKLFIKAVATFLVIYLFAYLSPATSISFAFALITTLVIVLPGWIGDRMVLPHLRNIVAASLDGVYAFAVLWIAALLAPFSTVTFTYLIFAALAIGTFEYMLHPTIYNSEEYRRKGARV